MRFSSVIVILLLMMTSCRMKYEKLLVMYERKKDRMDKAINERKLLDEEIPALNDSIIRLKYFNGVWKKYYLQSEEIKNLKILFYKEEQIKIP